MPAATIAKKKTRAPAKAALSKTVQTLGPWDRRYTPSYEVLWFREGDPRKPIHGEFDATSVVSIETAKNIQNIAGTWRIVFKDAKVEHAIQPMDVCVIRLKGHNQGLTSVLHGLVDEVGKEDSAEPESAQENTIVTGRCMGKYLQVNSLFLPVWETNSLLPTVLTFGLGDAEHKANPTPRAIFGYVFRRYIVGESKRVGISGTPAATHWLNKNAPNASRQPGRFEDVTVKGGGKYEVPYIQFDENTTDQVLTDLTITGFTEGWVDEFGYVVYRPPGWDLPVNYVLGTDGLSSDELEASDVGLVTYVEVVPSGALGISTAAQQALSAGRAPVPSSYLTGQSTSNDEGTAYVDSDFVIESNPKGEVTKKGAQNYWYKRQRKYGLRSYQVTSPLLVSHAQAQMQAQGLLKFLGNRLAKTATITIPGEPGIRLGTTILIRGTLRGKNIERTYYVEGVSHEYVDGHSYKTTLELTHGRDPWDPEWKQMVLPANPSEAALLAEVGGVAEPGKKGTSYEGGGATVNAAYTVPGVAAKFLANGEATAPTEAPEAIARVIAAGNAIRNKPYVYGGGHGESLNAVQESYDCSSSVSFLLHGGGLMGSEAMVSGEFETFGEAGAGQWITIYANADHVFMKVAGIIWDHGNGGWFPSLTAAGQSTEGYVVRHPKGL
jgi:hypothetical protein